MSTREQLDSYLKSLEKRLRLDVLLRGAAILIAAALAATLVLVLITLVVNVLARLMVWRFAGSEPRSV